MGCGVEGEIDAMRAARSFVVAILASVAPAAPAVVLAAARRWWSAATARTPTSDGCRTRGNDVPGTGRGAVCAPASRPLFQALRRMQSRSQPADRIGTSCS